MFVRERVLSVDDITYSAKYIKPMDQYNQYLAAIIYYWM